MSTDDKLDRILRRDAADDDIVDGGFTARVMDALPAAGHRSRAALRPALILGSAALGGFLAVLLAPAEANVLQGMIDLCMHQALTPAAFATMGLAATLFVSALLLARDN